MDKNNVNIESYDGNDAYYEGSDKDYEEFLKQVEGNTEASESAEPVFENDADDAGETINIKGVIDKVRQKAGEFGTAAKKIGDGMRVQFNDYMAAASERAEEKKAEILDAADEVKETLSDKAIEFADESGINSVSASISNTAKAAKQHIKSAQSKLPGSMELLEKSFAEVIEKIDEANSKINSLEAKEIENRNNYDRGVNDLRVSITGISNDLAEVKQNTASIAKLNDSIFDLKNTQQNIRKSFGEVEGRLISLKRKFITGITIISILSLIMIALEVINLFS